MFFKLILTEIVENLYLNHSNTVRFDYLDVGTKELQNQNIKVTAIFISFVILSNRSMPLLEIP